MRGQSLWLYWGSWSSFHAWPQTCGSGLSHMAVVVTSSEGKKNRGGKSFKEKGRDKMGVGKTKPSPIPSWHRQQGWVLVSLPTSPHHCGEEQPGSCTVTFPPHPQSGHL